MALLVNDAIFTTRALARGLSPVTFDRGGLALALEELARRLSAMFHIDVRCEADDTLDRGLESVNALHLYRIAQEAVTNAAQHGHGGQGARSNCAATANVACCASRTTATASTRPCTSPRGWACASCITARR